MLELPDHYPIDVDADGNGPAFGDDIAATVCWCGDQKCTRHQGQRKEAAAAWPCDTISTLRAAQPGKDLS